MCLSVIRRNALRLLTPYVLRELIFSDEVSVYLAAGINAEVLLFDMVCRCALPGLPRNGSLVTALLGINHDAYQFSTAIST
jgi:hypothetical protein